MAVVLLSLWLAGSALIGSCFLSLYLLWLVLSKWLGSLGSDPTESSPRPSRKAPSPERTHLERKVRRMCHPADVDAA